MIVSTFFENLIAGCIGSFNCGTSVVVSGENILLNFDCLALWNEVIWFVYPISSGISHLRWRDNMGQVTELGCLVTWFCYQLKAKPGNKTVPVPSPDPYDMLLFGFIDPSSSGLLLRHMITPFLVKYPWWIWVNLDNVIKWKHFTRYWPFLREIHQSLMDSPHEGQWRGALMFSLVWAWKNDWANSPDASD